MSGSPGRGGGSKKAARVASNAHLAAPKTNNAIFAKIFQKNAELFWSFLVTPVFAKKVSSNNQDVARPLREPLKQKPKLPEKVEYTDIISLSIVNKQMRMLLMQYCLETRSAALRRPRSWGTPTKAPRSCVDG